MGKGFFTRNHDAFQQYEDALDGYKDDQDIVRVIKAALSAISFSREEYDALTPYTANKQGQSLLDAMRLPLGREKLRRASYFLGAFVREATLVKDSRMGTEQLVLDYFLETPGHENEDEWVGYGFDYVRYTLPAALLEQGYSKIRSLASEVEGKKADVSKALSDVEERIRGYRSELDKLASEYNFVGLSDAFRKLLEQKTLDKNTFRSVFIALGLVAVLIPAILLTPLRETLALGVQDWGPSSVSRLAGLVGVELLVLYFFRIALKGYMVARNQVTNLQLRLALCTFIEGYLDFAEKAVGSNQKSGVAGFEALIFSDLPADDSRVPSTIDGVDQIVGALNLIKRPA